MDHGHHHHDAPHRHHGHGHTHAGVDPSIVSTDRGLWALKWSFVGLMITAAIQFVVVVMSGSVGLLADTIHNVADAATAIPLGIAFLLARRAQSRRFTYGLGRVEDLAGLVIILTILGSALVAGFESIVRLVHSQPVGLLWAVMVASVVGFVGNEAVAVFRIRVGRQIGSAALVADGYHARVDGWTSLAVFVGALGVWAGYRLADPIVGLAITAAILVIVWQSAQAVLVRMLDGVEPETVDAAADVAAHTPGIEEVTDVRARWVGHRLHADVSVTVPGDWSVAQGHEAAREVRHRLFHRLPNLGRVMVHIDPYGQGGEPHRGNGPHTRDDPPMHAHE